MFIRIDEFDQFSNVLEIPRSRVAESLVKKARRFYEIDDIESMIRAILREPNLTPHGPTEIVDILTQQLSFHRTSGTAGFILKGRSFTDIRPKDISHQIFRLRRISDLKFVILVFVGNLHDEAREEFVSTANDLKVSYSIIDSMDLARLSIAYGFICPKDSKKLRDGKCTCGYAYGGNILNIFQKEAVRALHTSHENQHESGIVIMPSGSGKTRVAAHDCYAIGAKRILYVAHTHEILDGAAKEFASYYGKNKLIYGRSEIGKKRVFVQLCTIQSLSRHLGKIGPNDYDYFVVDEFHHAAAVTYRKLIAQLKPMYMLGLTATPNRHDQQDVIRLCGGNIISRFSLAAGIEMGLLVPYNYYGMFDDVDYSQLIPTGQGYTIRDLDRVLLVPERDQAIVRKWRQYADNKATLAFCKTRKHARRMTDVFNQNGIPAALYDGTTRLDQRTNLVDSLKEGKIKVLVTIDVLNEGVDIPCIEALLFLRPTESERIFLQQLGRGLRRSPGKEKVVVLDFIGNFRNAFQIMRYLKLHDSENEGISFKEANHLFSTKSILNLPTGCEVLFEERVIHLFEQQYHDASRANRHNIGEILEAYYLKTSIGLGRPATKRDVDRLQILNSSFYISVFGSWNKFIQSVKDNNSNMSD